MARSSSDAEARVADVFRFFGWETTRRLTRDEADRVKRLLWVGRRGAANEARKVGRDPKPIRQYVGNELRGDKASPIEEILLAAMNTRSLLIGEFRRNFQVGPYRIDFAFPAVKLGVECDGRAYHTEPAQVARDRRRDQYLTSLGWTVRRYTGTRINRDSVGAAEEICALYERLLATEKLPEPWE